MIDTQMRSHYPLPRTIARWLFTGLVVLACWAALVCQGLAATPQARAVIEAIVRLDAEVPPTARTAQSLGTDRQGSGVVIDAKDGLVVTAGYLILEARSVMLTLHDEQTIPADVIAYDHNTGLGLVRANQALPVRALPINPDSTVSAGSPSLAISHGGEWAIVPTRVVDVRPYAGYWEYLLEHALFTAPPHPAHSGAALVGADGRLLGIGSLALPNVINDENLADESLRQVPGNVFIPIHLLVPILDDLLTYGRDLQNRRPWLGVYTEPYGEYLFIRRVATNGPADKAGLRAGMLIVRVGDKAVNSIASLYRAIWASGAVGEPVELIILQRGEMVRYTVKSADRYDWLNLKPSV